VSRAGEPSWVVVRSKPYQPALVPFEEILVSGVGEGA